MFLYELLMYVSIYNNLFACMYSIYIQYCIHSFSFMSCDQVCLCMQFPLCKCKNSTTIHNTEITQQVHTYRVDWVLEHLAA